MAQLSRTKKYQEFRDKLDEETTAAQSEPVKPRLSRVENHRLSHANKPLHSHEAGRASTNTKTDYQTSPVMDELLGEVKQYNIDNGTRITDDTQINILRQLDTPLEAKNGPSTFFRWKMTMRRKAAPRWSCPVRSAKIRPWPRSCRAARN